MRILGTLSSFGVGGNVETSYIGRQGNLEFIVGKNQFISYVADVVNDLILPSIPMFLENDEKIYFISEDTFPGGIGGIDYFVINSTENGFQLAIAPTSAYSTYNGGTTYNPGDRVLYSGSVYTNILSSTGNLPTNATFWTLDGTLVVDITSVGVGRQWFYYY